MMSWIQKHAMNVLLRSETATIKMMRPTDVPANLFAYHIDGLITDKLVKKSRRGTYELTDTGLKLAGTFSTATHSAQENIKTVVMIYGKDDNGRVLLFRWSRQPYIGEVTLPHDRMHFGKTFEQGISDAVTDKLGVSNLATNYKSNILIRIEHNGQLISHMNAFVFEVDVNQLQLPYVSRNGEAFLGKVGDVKVMGGMQQLIDQLAFTAGPLEATLIF